MHERANFLRRAVVREFKCTGDAGYDLTLRDEETSTDGSAIRATEKLFDGCVKYVRIYIHIIQTR